MQRTIQELEETIGYHFHDRNLAKTALCHRSYVTEHKQEGVRDNERLEFLGDAVLELSTSEFLYHTYPDMKEGEMTKLRASTVCEPTLAKCAAQFGLGSFLRLGRGEEMTGGRERDSIVSDAMEALIGAIFLDGGFGAAKAFIQRFVLNDAEKNRSFSDSKSVLQEIVQASCKGNPISYRLVAQEGPVHDRVFEVRLFIGERAYATGRGRSKKSAEQDAAYRTLLAWKGQTEGKCI